MLEPTAIQWEHPPLALAQLFYTAQTQSVKVIPISYKETVPRLKIAEFHHVLKDVITLLTIAAALALQKHAPLKPLDSAARPQAIYLCQNDQQFCLTPDDPVQPPNGQHGQHQQ